MKSYKELTIALILLVLLDLTNGGGPGPTPFNMPEYELIDEKKYPYDEIIDEDIWKY